MGTQSAAWHKVLGLVPLATRATGGHRASACACMRAAQAGPSGDALEIAVPAGLTRLFKHPVLDWGLMSRTQKKLAREVSVQGGWAGRQGVQVEQTCMGGTWWGGQAGRCQVGGCPPER